MLLTIAPRYEGYLAIGRAVLVGNPDPTIRRARDVAIRAQLACGQALRPGIEGRQVEAMGGRSSQRKGWRPFFSIRAFTALVSSSLNRPSLAPAAPQCCKKNMVISIDIPLFNTPWGGLRIEDGYLIKAQGAEALHTTPYVLQK